MIWDKYVPDLCQMFVRSVSDNVMFVTDMCQDSAGIW